MISHFQWKEIKNNWINREWAISFYYKGEHVKGSYFKDGSIDLPLDSFPREEQDKITSQIHDLMLYHVYEDHHPET